MNDELRAPVSGCHEFDLSEGDRRELSNLVVGAMERVKCSDEVAIFRSGLEFLGKAAWIEFLKEECGLNHDQRHYDFSEKMAISDWWEISYQPDKASSYTYSKTPQPFHTDNGWFAEPPEINFFAMESQARRGGEQVVYPVVQLIKDLEVEAPALLEELTSLSVKIQKGEGEEFNWTTVIRDADTASPSIYWNFYRTVRASERVEKMCQAFFDFLKVKQDSDSVFRIRMNTGDCFAFNDTRVLHGRGAFEAFEPRERVLLQSMWKI